jgi:hypothetical protein
MAENYPTTRADLLSDINGSWARFNAMLDGLSDEQLTGPRDAAGWNVKDHITHIASWERGIVYFLQGKPRHEGIGVSEDLFVKGDDDAINADVQKQRKDMPLGEALAEFRDVHAQLLALVEPLTDDDLRKPYRKWEPGEEGEGEGPPLARTIFYNTSEHFRDHGGWIETLVGRAAT